MGNYPHIAECFTKLWVMRETRFLCTYIFFNMMKINSIQPTWMLRRGSSSTSLAAPPEKMIKDLPSAQLDIDTCDTLPMDPDVFMAIPSFKMNVWDQFPETQVEEPLEGINESRRLPNACEEPSFAEGREGLQAEDSVVPQALHQSPCSAAANEVSKEAPDLPGGPLPDLHVASFEGNPVTPPSKKTKIDDDHDGERASPGPAYSPIEASMSISTYLCSC